MVARIAAAAMDLKAVRQTVAQQEAALMLRVVEYLRDYRGSQRELARAMGISAGYLHDIKAGNRKISDQMVERLIRLMEE